jgi:uncharacterized protein YutD
LSYILGDITTRVQQRVGDTGFSSTEIKGYINDAQRDVFNEFRLPFMEDTQNYTVTAGSSDITNGAGLPSNYVQAIDLILTSNGEMVIPYKDFREIDNYYPDPNDTVVHTAGKPQYWYFYANTIRLFPVPDNAYTLTLRYFKAPIVLSATTDIPSIPPEFEEILVMGAAYRVLQVKENYDQAGILQNKYDEILKKLVMRYSQSQVGTPTIMRTNRHAMGSSHF